MGMGEALANPHVFDALTLLIDAGYAGMSARRVTVPTAGFAPNLARLVDEHPQVAITLSVHSPFPQERACIFPLEERFPLAHSLDILDRHAATSRRKVYLAYLLIADVNASDDHLAALAELVHERSRPDLFHVSVIRYNEAIGAASDYRAPSSTRVDDFVRGLITRGVRATRRRQFGTAIDAACGQLHGNTSPRTPRSPLPSTPDGSQSHRCAADGTKEEKHQPHLRSPRSHVVI